MREGVIRNCIVDLKCIKCGERLDPMPDNECPRCDDDPPPKKEKRAHLRCGCGKAWLCTPAKYMQPSN